MNYICKNCIKVYKSKSSWEKHQRTCELKSSSKEEMERDDLPSYAELVCIVRGLVEKINRLEKPDKMERKRVEVNFIEFMNEHITIEKTDLDLLTESGTACFIKILKQNIEKLPEIPVCNEECIKIYDDEWREFVTKDAENILFILQRKWLKCLSEFAKNDENYHKLVIKISGVNIKKMGDTEFRKIKKIISS